MCNIDNPFSIFDLISMLRMQIIDVAMHFGCGYFILFWNWILISSLYSYYFSRIDAKKETDYLWRWNSLLWLVDILLRWITFVTPYIENHKSPLKVPEKIPVCQSSQMGTSDQGIHPGGLHCGIRPHRHWSLQLGDKMCWWQL